MAYQIEIIDVEDVDRLNVYQASKKGMIDAIHHIAIQPDFALSDAMPLGDEIAHNAIIKGDSLSMSIGAASILAKVTRDRIMKNMICNILNMVLLNIRDILQNNIRNY